MKRHELDTILEECLHRLQNGESVESCLALYTEVAEDLRPLLQTMQIIQAVPRPRPSLAVKEAGLARMLSAASHTPSLKKKSRWQQLGEMTMKTTIRFALASVVLMVVVAWLVSFWQEKRGGPDEVLESISLPTETATETSSSLPPPPTTITSLTPSPIPTDTAVPTATPQPPTGLSPTPTAVVIPTNQPTADSPLLLPPVPQNDGTQITVMPTVPHEGSAVEVSISGTAGCSAVPVYQSYQVAADVIHIEARKPGRNTVCAAVISNWGFTVQLPSLAAGEYRIEFYVLQDEIRELWGRAFMSVAMSPTAVPTLTCDQQAQTEGRYIISFQDSLFTNGVTAPGETVAQVAERLAAAHGGTVTYIYEYALLGFAASGLTPESAAALAQEPEVNDIDLDTCVYPLGPAQNP